MSSRKRRKRRSRTAPVDSSAKVSPPGGRAGSADADPAAGARRRRVSAPDERPPAPWGTFPLVELLVLVGIVMLIAGFVVQGRRGTAMIFTGIVLASLGGLELAIREHWAGYRSHTLLLSSAAGVAVLAALALLVPSLWFPVALAIAVAAFAAAALGLMHVFRRGSGLSFKLR
jgi:hypothetical protein